MSTINKKQKVGTIKTKWETSLPDTGDAIVSIMLGNNEIYTGSNGIVFKLNFNGKIRTKNPLPDRGNHEIRFADVSKNNTIYLGTAGYVLALGAEGLATEWQKSLPDTGDAIVSILVANNAIYAGSYGIMFKLDFDGNRLCHNSLPERGNHEIRLAFDPKKNMIYLGTAGYVIALDASDLSTKWQTSLSKTGSAIVSVLMGNNAIYAGSWGYIFSLDTRDGYIQSKNTLPDRGNNEIRFALSSDKEALWIGTSGYVIETGVPTIWEQEIVKSQFEEIPYPTSKITPDIIIEQGFDNSSEAEMEETFKHNHTKSCTFELTLKETLHTGAKAEFTSKVPFIGSAKTEISIDLTLESQQKWQTTESEDYEISTMIKIPAHSRIIASWIIDWAKDIEIPFFLWIKVTAKHASGTPLSTNELISKLSSEGFNGEVVDKSKQNEVTVKLTGTLKGSYGMRSYVKTQNK